ncbi:MAG TPA: hemerythrin domain-containing protein [Nitrospiraceae bacterium]|nr:hemerythrin domain-containing protein [Nitrospiraceae bacterium]
MREDHVEAGSISGFLTEDHRRLEQLLDLAGGQAGEIAPGPYEQFRAGLLRHIGMEEKILFPAIQRAQQDRADSPVAPSLATSLGQLRLEHGALAALLMPSPTPAVLATIREILRRHDEIEESAGGPYAVGDRLLGQEAGRILAALRAAPAVTVMPHSDSPAVAATLHRALARAGYSLGGARRETDRREARSPEP